MKRIFISLMTVVVTLSCMLAGVGPAAAQSNETVSDEPALDELPDRAISFNDATHISDWNFDDGRATVEIRTDLSVTVEIADSVAGIGQDGATRIPEHSFELERGTHRLTVPVEEFRGGHSIGVATDAGTVRISSEMQKGMEIPGDPTSVDWIAGGLTVIAIAIVGLVLMARWFKRENGGVVDVF